MNERREIIHTDVCGPMRTQSISGRKYFVTFIDDFSHYCEIYFLKQKSDLYDTFKTYKASVENFTAKKI